MIILLCLISVVAGYHVREHHLLHRCPRHEHLVVNSTNCPTTCSNGYFVAPSDVCDSFTGCVCNDGLVRLFDDATGPCIPTARCPLEPIYCGPHEVRTECENRCLESCAHVYSQELCIASNDCNPGCKCIENHLRNELGMCIPSEYCPGSHICVPTCSQPNPKNCPDSDRNLCEPGHILSHIGGVCIKIEDCPVNGTCNSDPNAIISQCPSPCPSSCGSPNARPCIAVCEPVGCQCKPGYILSEVDGRCVLPDQCPGGNPCGANGTYVNCRATCLTNYCPIDDTRGEVMCDMPFPCPSGCVCDFNYKHRSIDDETCVLSEDCPPVTCTRPNEVWDSCPSTCLYENCNDVDNPYLVCDDDSVACEPRCVCDENHYRNDDGVCVPEEECPSYYLNKKR